MFPHSDTVYTVHGMRLQDELQYAARQRLAATVETSIDRQPLHLALRAKFARACGRMIPGRRTATTAYPLGRPITESERATMLGAGMV